MPVGFCGLGAMGSAIAERLLAQGHRLTVWNRTADRAAALVTRGAPTGYDSRAAIAAQLTCNDRVIARRMLFFRVGKRRIDRLVWYRRFATLQRRLR